MLFFFSHLSDHLCSCLRGFIFCKIKHFIFTSSWSFSRHYDCSVK
jgi:hypothetical protein